MAQLSQREFAAAVDRHYRIVFQLSAGLLGDPAEAEDVTQETFTQFWQHGAEAEHPKAWLLRVARNRCLDRLRRRKRLEYRDHESLPEAIEHRDGLASFELDEMSASLRSAVDALPEPHRSIVLLFALQGMSGKDCAAALGITVNQVKVYLHRARTRLRKDMSQHLPTATEASHG